MARGTALSFAVLTARPIVQQTSLRRYASSLSPSSVAIPRGRVIASGTRRLLPASLTYRRRFNDGAWTRRDVNETPTTATSLNGTAAQGSVVVHSASIAMPYHSPNPILTIHHSPLLGKTRSGINAAVNVIEKTASTTSTADASRTAATTTNHQHPPHSERALSLTIRPAFTIAQLETLLRQDLALHESTAGQPAFVVYQNYDSSAGESAGSNTMTSIASDGQPTFTVASSSTTTATEPRSKKASNNIATPADGVDLADRERWSRWSAATTIEEILKDGFRHTGNHDEQRRPIVWAELNGQPMRIVLPSFKGRSCIIREIRR